MQSWPLHPAFAAKVWTIPLVARRRDDHVQIQLLDTNETVRTHQTFNKCVIRDANIAKNVQRRKHPLPDIQKLNFFKFGKGVTQTSILYDEGRNSQHDLFYRGIVDAPSVNRSMFAGFWSEDRSKPSASAEELVEANDIGFGERRVRFPSRWVIGFDKKDGPTKGNNLGPLFKYTLTETLTAHIFST